MTTDQYVIFGIYNQTTEQWLAYTSNRGVTVSGTYTWGDGTYWYLSRINSDDLLEASQYHVGRAVHMNIITPRMIKEQQIIIVPEAGFFCDEIHPKFQDAIVFKVI